MKTTKNILLLLAMLLTISVLITSCKKNNDNDDDENCPGTVAASWKVNGVTEESRIYLHSHVGSLLNFTFPACNDNVLGLVYLPYPPVPGTYPLKNGAAAVPVEAQGAYSVDGGADYVTNASVVGEVTITDVNTTNKTLSGTFHFDAKDYDGTDIIEITDGVLTNAKYEE